MSLTAESPTKMPRPRIAVSAAWKWGVVLALIAVAGLLLVWKPRRRPVKVELLPIADSLPSWDGSYPYLTISLGAPGADRVGFDTSTQFVKPTVRHGFPINEFQVDLHSGQFVLRQSDLFVPDVIPLSLTRTYHAWDFEKRASEFGAGTNHPYDICPTGTRFPYTYMDLNLEDGQQIHFDRISKGTGYADAVFRHGATSSEFYEARIAWNGDGWNLDFRDGRRFLFPEAYYAKSFAQGAPFEMNDGMGHRIQLKRDKQRRLAEIVSPSGRAITLQYDEADRIVAAMDSLGNLRKYAYDATDHLESVADESHVLYRFRYEPLLHAVGFNPYLMTAVLDGNGKELLRNIYDGNDTGRISEQRTANGEVYRYKYVLSSTEIVETNVFGPSGNRTFFFRHGIFWKEK